jgi:uncharacterized protein (TIGR03083 family)
VTVTPSWFQKPGVGGRRYLQVMALDFLEHVRNESSRFAEVLRAADPQARVPSCPDWNSDDLLYHLAEVFDFWTTIVRDQATGDDVSPPERPVERDDLLALYDRTTTALLDVLATTPLDRPMWSWVTADVTVAWLPRRMAHEALIHRLDAELTTTAVTPFPVDLASDGVDEVLRYFFNYRPEWAEFALDGPVGQLRASDTGEAVLVQLGSWSGVSPNTGKAYEREATVELVTGGEPSFVISATARDLDVWLWNRPTLAALTIDGDASGLQAIVAQGLQ